MVGVSPEEYVEAVLTLVEQIPPGRVMSYGAIAEYLYDCSGRGSSRLVGTIMARHGGGVPWHRVVNSTGRVVPGHENRARELLLAEGVRFKGDKVLMAEASWWPEESRSAKGSGS